MSEPSTILKVSELTKSFRSGNRSIEVLRGIEMSMRQGESISIRGESGSGKTTLLNIIAGLEYPDKGKIFWRETLLSQLSASSQAKQRAVTIGMVYQAFYLIPELDAFENVMMASRILGLAGRKEKSRACELLERVGLKERLDSSTLKLSGGERQRVAVARALMNKPSLILADEPTGNLDENTGKEIIDLLMEISREEDVSLILVTHNPDYAMQTQRQFLLHFGELQVQ